MQNEPIHEIKFLNYLANKLSQEIKQANIMLTNEQLNGLYADVEKLIANINKIETKANVFHKTHGSAITI